MDVPSLFPRDANPNTNSSEQSSDPSVHISFKAGLLNMDEATKQVTPDERPGLFQIRTSVEDGLVHIEWKPRATANASVEKDLILISGEIEMKKVVSCSPSARVYILKWRDANTNTRMFLWMQEPDMTQDSTRLSLVNSILEHGPTPSSQQV